jgi:hypothetical protein
MAASLRYRRSVGAPRRREEVRVVEARLLRRICRELHQILGEDAYSVVPKARLLAVLEGIAYDGGTPPYAAGDAFAPGGERWMADRGYITYGPGLFEEAASRAGVSEDELKRRLGLRPRTELAEVR